VRRNLSNEAQNYYAHAVNALMANEHYASAEIPSVLGKLV
jgi:hypothetical protein